MGLTDEDKLWIRSELDQSEARTAAAIERTETRLLTAFHQWASPVETRVRSLSLALGALDQEGETASETHRKLAELEQRLRLLEKRADVGVY